MFNSLFSKEAKKEAPNPDKVKSKVAFYEEQKPQLPPNFAQNVMELEMQLEFIESYNMEVVQQLNELYRVRKPTYRWQLSTTSTRTPAKPPIFRRN